jgi:hypothetical protein
MWRAIHVLPAESATLGRGRSHETVSPSGVVCRVCGRPSDRAPDAACTRCQRAVGLRTATAIRPGEVSAPR